MWRNQSAELNTSAFAPALTLLLETTIERAAMQTLAQVTEGDLLYCLLEQRADNAAFLALPEAERTAFLNAVGLLKNYLAPGVQLTDCLDAFDAVALRSSQEINPFERESWREPLGALIDGLPEDAGLQALLEGLFAAAETLPDGDLLTGLFRQGDLLAALAQSKVRRELFDESGALCAEVLRDRALFLLEQGLQLAARGGAAQAEPLHLLSAMVQYRESFTNLLLRRTGASAATARAANYLANAYGGTNESAARLPSVRASLSPALTATLEAALRTAAANGQARMGERELLLALLDSDSPKARYLLDDVLRLEIELFREVLVKEKEPDIIEPALPLDVCDCRNLTLTAQGTVPRPELLPDIVKVFFRKKNHNVLLHGDSGVGLSSVAEVLAEELRKGTFAAFRQTQVIRFDLSAVPPEDYVQAVERLFTYMDNEPQRIYVLEGFGKYFCDQFAACSRRLARNAYRLIAVVNTAEYTKLQNMSEVLSTFIEPIAVAEPSRDQSAAMIECALPGLEKEYGVTFAKGIVPVVMRMAGDYLISKRFPKKAVELLDWTAADVAAEIEMRGKGDRTVTKEAVAQRLSSQTSLPVETILGTGADKDYVYLLSRQLMGQEMAVGKVAGRLDLIQKGMVDKKAPAAVFVFAGLSGTGKTELAKQIAQIYSSSRRLITFEMASFGEAHSVSRMIGTPPGYVGYEEGGKLINDLIRDPYSVVLLDEIEKAHPKIWDPFLNLFDEGVITDMRGVTASGSKAFFVLTSNVGQFDIARMLARGCGAEEIEAAVLKQFNEETNPKTGEKCFRPEFIGRIMRRGGIVVFNALSLEAITGIARHMVGKVEKSFAEVYDSKLVCDDEVIDMLARITFEGNEAGIREPGKGYFGARPLDQLLDSHINNKLAAKLRQISGAPMVRIVLNGRETELVPVFNEADAQELLRQRRLSLLDRVNRRFDKLVTAPDGVFDAMKEEQLASLDRLLSEVGSIL